ncbi:hypothetical protein HYU11_06665 [Candidatus Woesearchaeota archaeon]|nr:hypothetical protein [Candidatus Woesearchaeota archaeon]
MTNYYVSILQLRNVSPEIQEFAESQITGTAKAFLTKKKKVRNGFDYYLSSNSFAVGLGRILRKRFGGELKVSEKLYSRDRQTSRDLYRVNVLYRQLPLNVGSVVELGGNVLVITSVGKKVVGLDLETGKKRFLDISGRMPGIIEPSGAVVSKVYPVTEVIRPDTFESVRLFGRFSSLNIGEKVKVVVVGERAFFVRKS